MKEKRFKVIVDFMLKRTKDLLINIKAKEYAREDRLHNFNRLSELQNQPREKSLINLCDKQYISIHDMIDDIEKGNFNPDLHLWDEKIGDVIAYMVLLKAVVVERAES